MDQTSAVAIAAKITARSIAVWANDPDHRVAAVQLLVLGLPRYDRAFRRLSPEFVTRILEQHSPPTSSIRRIAARLLRRERARTPISFERGAAALAVLANQCGAFEFRGRLTTTSLADYIIKQVRVHEAKCQAGRERRGR
jgi:hypothetical protein